jgi:hypothetical protein
MVQCIVKTKKNKRCKNSAMLPYSVCFIHMQKEKISKIISKNGEKFTPLQQRLDMHTQSFPQDKTFYHQYLPSPNISYPRIQIPSCPRVDIPPCPRVECPRVDIPPCPRVDIPPCPKVECPRVDIPPCPKVECPRVDIPPCPKVECPRVDIPPCPK